METIIALFAGIIGLFFAGLLAIDVLRKERGTERMIEISEAIREGAMAYLNRQYRTIGIFALILFVVLALVIKDNFATAITFITGAVCSALAGYIGMNVSVRGNVRVANAAKDGLKKALKIAFRGGAVTGFCVAGLALLGVSVYYYVYGDPILIVGFGFGACLISLFARIGGGIYTKAADVGADLVGKVEKGIPEDDPRNPAVIADQVGDNVGDCAGMGADLFETYAVTAIGAMLLGHLIFMDERYISYPLMLGAVAIFASMIGSFFVRLGKKESIIGALYKGLLVTGLVSAIGFYFVTEYMLGDIGIYYATLCGLSIAIFLFAITEYYTSTKYSPVRSISEASQSGPAVNIITGLALGLECTAIPAIVICTGILISYYFAGIYGIAIAAMGMISLTGIVIALDSYGPITDNAGGIAEMADLDPEVRKVTDALDAVGNTTKAVTKAFAIGSAALAALTLFAAYVKEVVDAAEELLGTGLLTEGALIYKGFEIGEGISLPFMLSDPLVLVGLLIGGMIPFLFCARCMKAVGRAAFFVVEEVRRQFREIPGIMEGTGRPEYARCVDIVTRSALHEMRFPGLLAVIAPLAVGFILGPKALGGLLLGSIVSGFLLALQMATGGAAWDNGKKYIEDGNYGGKGSEAHKAAVVGDTVGDPCKDTAGPAINPLIKVMNTISLIFAGLIVLYGLM
ncbi:MAG: sodium-translocating pyrophosphatase [Candidatus Syntropharchaeia archaeon]